MTVLVLVVFYLSALWLMSKDVFRGTFVHSQLCVRVRVCARVPLRRRT